MAEYKLKALRSYQGDEGTVRRGDIFSVESEERADVLKKLELAETAPNGAEITNFHQKNKQLQEMKVDELKEVAESEGVNIPDDALKEDIKTAILSSRERNYITEQAQQTARAQRGTESGTTGGGTATGTTGGAGGTTGGTGAAAGGSTGGTGGGAAGGSTGGA